MGRNNRYLKFTGTIENQTAKAILFAFSMDYDPEWLPRSQIKGPKENFHSDEVEIEIPEWLCRKNGWAEDPEDVVDMIERDDDAPF